MEETRANKLIARKLSGEASSEELAELQLLLDKHPGLKETYHLMAEHWDAAAAAPAKDMDEKYLRLWQAIGTQSGGPRRSHFHIPRFKWLAAAASITLVVALAWYFTRTPAAPGTLSEVSTKYGSRSKIVLPDGSRVWLNAGSRLTYSLEDFNKKKRSVQVAGEAFFDIAPLANAPFTVHTEIANIQVLGTRFDVKAYPEDNEFEACLISGAIVVAPKVGNKKTIRLKPGQRLTLGEDKHTENAARPEARLGAIRMMPLNSGADSLLLETAWTENKLAFTSEPFYELATKIQRWYNVKINFSDSTVKNYRFTGVFENETLEQALAALQLTGSFQYRVSGNEVFIEK